jgi:hypothetical protein
LVPFFGWHLLAYGAIPIDRSNRDQAVKAIAYAADQAGCGDTVCVSPEGTRSTSGQILPFKKGPFHLWEQLKTPMIPLVIYGAYDLLPPGYLMCIPGKVYARFLPPIYPTEATNRDEMSYIVRKQMLQAWKDGPKDAGGPLSWQSRILMYFYIAGTYAFAYFFFTLIPFKRYLSYYHLSKAQAWGLLGAFCIGITIVFYVYMMYLAPAIKFCLSKILGGRELTRGLAPTVAAARVNINSADVAATTTNNDKSC